jgi:hypothetical protein
MNSKFKLIAFIGDENMKLTSVLASAALLVSATAFAETGSEIVTLNNLTKTSAVLNKCGGSATLVKSVIYADKYRLLLQDIENCSRVSLNGERLGKLERSNAQDDGDGALYLNMGSTNRVVVSSGSGATESEIIVTIQEVPAPGINVSFDKLASAVSEVYGASLSRTVDLKDCGGKAEITYNASRDELRVIFSQVESCSKFDVKRANGVRIDDYDTKTLRKGSSSGLFYGTFQIPKRMLGLELNSSLKVVLKSNSGKHDEIINIKFANW